MRRWLAIGLFATALPFAACGGDREPAATGSVAPSSAPKHGAGDEIILPAPARSSFYATTDGFTVRAKTYRARVDPDHGEVSVWSKSGDTIALRTESIRRSQVLWRAGDREGATLRGGRIHLDRGAVREELVTRDEGVEQTWTFPERPSGQGDLEVRLHASAHPALAMREGRARAGALGVRDAVWVDANGARTPLRMALAGEALVLRVPSSVVERSAYPATLDPVIGPELAIDAPIVAVHDHGTWGPKVAAGKNGTALVAWPDYRVPSYFGNSMFTGNHMFATRITTAGTVLDPTGIPVVTERDGWVDWFAIAYDGTQNWFLTWTEVSNNNPCGSVWGAVVSDQGVPTIGKEAPGGCSADHVVAAFDGTTFITGLSLYDSGLWVTRFSTAGEPLDVLPKQITTDNVGSVYPGLGCRPGACLVVWSAGTTTKRAARIGPNLTIVDTTPIPLPSGAGDIAGVVWDGQKWVVAYGNLVVHVDPDTAAVTGPVTVSSAAHSMAWDGTNTWLVWPDASKQIQADRVTAAGALVPGGPLTITTSADVSWSASIAFGGTTGFVAWDDTRLHSDADVYATRVAQDGTSLDGDGIVLNKAANGERNPAVAANGSGYLVGWVDLRGATDNWEEGIYVARLDANGTALDAPATLVDAIGDEVAVASDGTDYLVVYRSAGIKAVRVSGSTGAVLGPAVALAPSGHAVSVAHDGTRYIAAWIDAGATKAVTVANDGVTLGATLTLGSVGGGSWYARTAVAPGDASSLVVWPGGAVSGLEGARIDTAGNVLDTPPIAVGDSVGRIFAPAAAWDGTQWIVAWEDYRTGHIIDSEIYAARVSAGGVVQTPKEIHIAGGTSVSEFPAVIGMDDGYSDLVTWGDTRNPARYQDYALLGTWVRRSDGKVLDPEPVVISDRLGNELFPAMAPAGKGRVLVVYSATDYTSGFGNNRIRARFVGSGTATGATCTSDADCVTRACADGVCCDRACKGTCETCKGTGGKCTAVAGAEDPDSCAGEDVCSISSTCKRKPGRGCAVDADCATGHCAEGICCESTCNGPCESCAPLTGKCALRPARAPGGPSCAPYACDGESATCPTSCTSDLACPVGTRCERASGHCISGTSCIDLTTAALADQTPVDCAPYTCSAGSCRTSCRSVGDCVAPFVCDENGACVRPVPPEPAPESGCSAAAQGGTRAPLEPVVALLAVLACAVGRRVRVQGPRRA